MVMTPIYRLLKQGNQKLYSCPEENSQRTVYYNYTFGKPNPLPHLWSGESSTPLETRPFVDRSIQETL